MILYLDFETFYSDEYSLKKMTPPEYILDDRFETIGCSVAVDDEPAHWVEGPDLPAYFAQFDPAKTTTVTFNALFDNCILAWRFGFIPARMYCAMRLAAALRGHVLTGLSLGVVAKHLGIGEKGTFIANAKGMHLADLKADPLAYLGYRNYANNDNELSRTIFKMLIREFPHGERKVMDRVLRCAVEPAFHADKDMLQQNVDEIEARTALAMNAAGVLDPKELRSTERFKEILEAHGIQIEYKPAITDPTRMIPCFAKTDDFMAQLLEHEDETIQALATARLGLRSTIERTRSLKIAAIAALNWPVTAAGNMPIPLRYAGAHTHRLSGEWGINMQNLPSARSGTSKLRKALRAPPGYKVLVADLSQIECRICAWICGEEDLLNQFANKQDPYMLMGEKMFGMAPGSGNKKVHELERFIGKTGVLGLGFGCGADKFYNMVLRMARGLKMDMNKLMQVWNTSLAQQSVDIYRQANPNIKKSWRVLGDVLQTSWCGATEPVRWGPHNVVEIGHGYVLLPNGLKMLYEPVFMGAVAAPGSGDMGYRYGKFTHRMYGPKLLENIVQALARVVVMNAALRLWDRDLKFKLQAHDELAFIVPEAEAEGAKALVLEEMCRPPSWAPELPLAAEANYGDSYGDAK